MFKKLPSILFRGTVARICIACVLALSIAFAAGTGAFQPVENSLRVAGFEFSKKPASGQIHVVEMDAASLEAIQQWPWSRTHYAAVVAQLDAAGVRSIGFDVDFSSASNAAADKELAEALSQANAPIVLPTFAQSESFRSERMLDVLPIAPLREHTQMGSVSIVPDPDGFVRRMPLGTITSGTPRPSLSAYFAGKAGIVGESFPIDFAIDAGSVPRHSFIDIERGDFNPAQFRGKDVLIGATAVEMGDRYAVPRYGVIPGVIVQALATETLIAGQPVYGSWELPLLLAALFAAVIFGSPTYLNSVLRMAGFAVTMVALSHYSYTAFHTWFDIVPALTLIITSAIMRNVLLGRRQYLKSQRRDRETGLPNAIALRAHIDRAHPEYVVAAMLDEFDTLKAVLSAEDLPVLLRRLTDRLKLAADKQLVCRTDDRMLAWSTPSQLFEVEEQLASLRALMLSPIEIGGRRFDVPLTFGVADARHDRAIANAAHAANAAHRAGDKWQLHEADRSQHLEQQVSLMGELDESLRDGHVKVYYQPKLDLKSGQITKTEALVRWDHPQKGMLPPDSFIPLAEESGRIEDLTIFVLQQAIADMEIWATKGMSIGTAVNVSARLLTSRSFVDRALALIDAMKVPVEQLLFEVTESAELADWDASIETLQKLRARGIAISMDDYGTGQSTLSYLKALPLSELKIDRSFVQHAHIDRGDAMLVRSTVQLAHELGLKVVAEGVEDAECLAFLKTIDCDYAQGYFVARPMVANELVAMVTDPARIAA